MSPLAEPDGDVGGRQGGVHRTGQVVVDRVGVQLSGEASRERGQHAFGVIPGPVEPVVHPFLDPRAERAEQGRGGQRGPGHRHRGREPDHVGAR